MTSNYIVFIEQPFVMNLAKAAMTYLKSPPFRDWLEWRPELRNRFFVVDKSTGKVMKTEFVSKDPFFFLHQVNAYEEDDQIIIDINAYPNADVLDSLELCKLRKGDFGQECQGSCHRYVIPLVQAKDVPENIDLVAVKSDATATRVGNSVVLTPEILTKDGLELPTCNKRFLGQKYSFFYAAGTYCKNDFTNSICKIDVKKRETAFWKDSDSSYPGEPIFIPNPKGISEDDGVLISAVIDTRENGSDFIVILDAKNLKELGRAKFKAAIPQALHGLFIH
jgi:beta-carotene 15,15'-monooxygenase